MSRLRVTEIFHSLQGESLSIGLPTVFVRLTGCPLRCAYCDTDYAFSGGEWLELPQILDRVGGYDCEHVCVTGGEPLAQPACLELLEELCNARYKVSLETGGANDLCRVDPRVARVMDIKTPGSGEEMRNRWDNIGCLHPHDQVKFVLCDEADYQWACRQLIRWELPGRCEVLFSPVHGRLDPRQLAEWILRDRLRVRFQIQLHKYLWGEDARGR